MNQIKSLPLRCVVIEDEPAMREFLCKQLAEFPNVKVVGSCGDFDGSFDLIVAEKPDCVFLDVKIVGGDAFMLIDRLQKVLPVMPSISIITGYIEEYASEMMNQYKNQITHLLLKPFIKDFKMKLQNSIDAFVEHKKNALQTVLFKTQGGLRRLQVEELYYLEVSGNGRTRFVTKTGEFVVDLTLVRVIELLPSLVVQCNRNFAINVEKVIFMDLQSATLMVDGKEMVIKITETFMESVREAFIEIS